MALVLESPQYVALLGCTGSGKSLLASILRRVPGTRFVSECLLPDCVAHVVNQPLAPEVRYALSAGFAHKLRIAMTSGRENSRIAALFTMLSGQKGFAEFVSVLRNNRDSLTYFFESNFFTLAPDFVLDAVPNCLIVHIVRDGRDCAEKLNRRYNTFSDENLASLDNAAMFIGTKHDNLYVPWWVDEDSHEEFISASPFVRCMWFWKAMAARFQSFHESLDGNDRKRVTIVRYEDLVSQPTATVDGILRFINRPDAVGKVHGLHRIHANEIGRSQTFDQDELRVATNLASEELAYYGYNGLVADLSHSPTLITARVAS